MALYYFKCNKDHTFCFHMSHKAYEKFVRQCDKLLKVCSECKPVNNKLIEYIPPVRSKFDDDKIYICVQGHQTRVGIFSNGIIHISWDENHQNIESSTEDFYKKIKDGIIKCRCDLNLIPIDDSELKPPAIFGIKTKVRVGDIWDKAKCPDAKASHYDSDNNFIETDFAKRNKERLKKIRKERISKPAGTPITKPTKRRYKRDA